MPGFGFGGRKAKGVPVARVGRGGWERAREGAPALVFEREPAKVEIHPVLTMLFAVIGSLVKGARWVAVMTHRYPFTALAILAALIVVQAKAVALAVVLLGVITLVGLVLAWRWPHLYNDWFVLPAQRYRRRRRLGRAWERLCRMCDLNVTEHNPATGDRTSWTPRLTRLRWTGSAKAVLAGQVRIVPGQTVDTLTEKADKLASAAGARWCRVTSTGPNTATVAFLYGDPLAQPIRPMPLLEPDSEAVGLSTTAGADLTGVPVGITETGDVWRLKLAESHLLIAGSTGAGKSSLVWALLRGIAGDIRTGRVQVWGIDGKGGVELWCGRDLFTRFATTSHDGLTLLEAAVEAMQARADRMAGNTRQHVATTSSPLIVVLVDEVALLTAYDPDRKRRERAVTALSLLATQGRALGVVVVATLQDPRKDVLTIRHLFPVRVGMRLDTPSETDMVLGDSATELGATCHTIAESTAGVAFVKIDGKREPLRVRSAYLSDDDVRHLAATHAAPLTVHPSGHPYLDETTPTREPVWKAGAPTDTPEPVAPAEPTAPDVQPVTPAAPVEPVEPVPPVGPPVPPQRTDTTAGAAGITEEQLAQLRWMMNGGEAA